MLIGANAQEISPPLGKGQKLIRTLGGDEAHRYRINAEKDEYLHIVAEQRGVDVILSLLNPNGGKIVEIDSPNGTLGVEEIWAVAAADGEYIVEVRGGNSKARAAEYEISLAEQRPSVPDDPYFVRGMGQIADALAILLDRSQPRDLGMARLKEAEREFASMNDTARRGLAARRLADAYNDTGTPAEARRLYELAIPLLEESGSKKEATEAYFYSARLNPDMLERLRRSERAVALARETNNENREADSRLDVGNWALTLGEFELAMENYRAALAISQAQRNSGRAAVALGNIGITYRNMGDYASALNYQMEAMKVASGNSPKPRPLSLMALGTLYGEMGNYELSRQYTQKAIEGFRSAGSMDPLRVAMSNLGQTYTEEGNFEKGLEIFEQALEMMKEAKRFAPSIHCQIAQAKKGLGDLGQARTHALRCLADNRTIKSRFDEIRTLLLLSEIELADNAAASSLNYANEAAERAGRFGYTGLLFSSISQRAQSLFRLGRNDEAREAAQLAIQMTESLRRNFIGDRSQQNFFDKIGTPFHLLIQNEIETGNANSAWSIAERMKARYLIDLINRGPTGISKGLSESEIGAESRLRREMAAISRRLSDELAKEVVDKGLVDKLRADLTQKRLAMEDLQTQFYAAHPELRGKRAEWEQVPVNDVTSGILPANAAALEFVVTPENTFLIVATRERSAGLQVKGFQIAAPGRDLNKLVESFRGQLESGDLSFSETSRELYRRLLKPAEAQLQGKNRIIIVPDGPLWELPFQALMDQNGVFLVEKAAISSAPSLIALREMFRRAKEKRHSFDSELIAFGNPNVERATKERFESALLDEKIEPLPEAERLVKELRKMYGPKRSKVYIGSDAGEGTAKAESPKFRVVQFATHGVLNNISPMYSNLVLNRDEKNIDEDGMLEAWELKDLNLNADLVILSACETARGRISSGEGMIGMTWASFIAGAPTTVASQWKVESSSTTELMLEFHRQLLSRKVSKAEALRRAELKVMKMPKYRNPSYWAGFVMVGDGS